MTQVSFTACGRSLMDCRWKCPARPRPITATFTSGFSTSLVISKLRAEGPKSSWTYVWSQEWKFWSELCASTKKNIEKSHWSSQRLFEQFHKLSLGFPAESRSAETRQAETWEVQNCLNVWPNYVITLHIVAQIVPKCQHHTAMWPLFALLRLIARFCPHSRTFHCWFTQALCSHKSVKASCAKDQICLDRSW